MIRQNVTSCKKFFPVQEKSWTGQNNTDPMISVTEPAAPPETIQPTESATEPGFTMGGIPLTEEQLQRVNEAFASTVSYELNGLTVVESTIASCFFTSYYSQPQELSLVEFLRYCPLSTGASEEEQSAVLDYLESDRLHQPCHKFLRSDIDDSLMTYMGITTSDLQSETDPWLIYLEEYDSYYNFTSDFGPGSFICLSGEICGDVVYLYSQSTVLTLVQQDGAWLIYSHTPLGSSPTVPAP